MGFLNSIFKKAEDCKTVDEAKQRLSELHTMADTNRRKALKLLRIMGRRSYAFIGLDKPLNRDLRLIAGQLLQLPVDLPSVTETEWKRWPEPTFGHINDLASSIDTEVLFIRSGGKHRATDAVAEIEVLHLFRDEQVALVIYGTEEVFVRCSFLPLAAAHIESEAEEILQDLVDTCGKLTLKHQIFVV